MTVTAYDMLLYDARQLSDFIRALTKLAELNRMKGERGEYAEAVVMRRLNSFMDAAMDVGRIDELKRIQSATLDADQDVWSKTDDGDIVSLTDRLEELQAPREK